VNTKENVLAIIQEHMFNNGVTRQEPATNTLGFDPTNIQGTQRSALIDESSIYKPAITILSRARSIPVYKVFTRTMTHWHAQWCS
jgi:hypothetical protein